MPPVPPARRQVSTPVTPAKVLTTKQSRFLRLFFHDDPHPVSALTQAQFDALPASGRAALAWVATQARIEPHTARLLEAYYAAGYKPCSPFHNDALLDYGHDLSVAMGIGEGEHGGMSTLLSYIPATSDKNVIQRLIRLNDEPELKAGEKIRLEALRLLLQLKGHLRDDQAATTHATQIVIHTAQEPAVRPQDEPRVIEIDL